jgi:hypothetical protein
MYKKKYISPKDLRTEKNGLDHSRETTASLVSKL